MTLIHKKPLCLARLGKSPLWWTTGQPNGADVTAAICGHSWLRDYCRAAGNAEGAKTFVSALGPFLVVLILGLFSYLGSNQARNAPTRNGILK